MMVTKKVTAKNNNKLNHDIIKTTIRSCRIRLILMLTGLFFILLYHILKRIPGAANAVYLHVIHPLHGLMASICDHVGFSVGELLIAIAVIALIVYIVSAIVLIFKRKEPVRILIHMLITFMTCFAVIYGGFCILWGVYYSAEDTGVDYMCGISSEGNSHEDLVAVDRYFVNMANSYSTLVTRDENGCYVMDEDKIFGYSLTLYDNVSSKYPALKSKAHIAKPVFCSKVCSYLDFTGFFFPFTGEANINIDAPDCMTPSVIAHELAHQRGIAEEDEANFMAVLASMEDGDPDYVYSSCLMALIHLQNALYKSGDKDSWQEIYASYSEGVLADIEQNNEYWKPFRKSVTYKASNSTYSAFLRSYDQDLGLETYGACVDLLVDYYKEEAYAEDVSPASN